MAMLWLLTVSLCWNVLFLTGVRGSTHWVVTEDGRIQSQTDSLFNMRMPHDLVAFLHQEERADMLQNLKQDLLIRKEEIDRNEDKDTGLEQRFYKEDPDCIVAGKPLPDYDLYISTVLPLENKGIRPQEHLDMKATLPRLREQPDCTKAVPLPFSINAFEHLEGMKDRVNLTGTPELGLKNAITHRDNVDDFGHLVSEAMKKNQTSWVLYNMAAFFWRIKGDPYYAVECARRALHFSPYHHKDVALISLANVLHRARYSSEAAIIVHAAIEISRELNVNHFTLGNIFAVLAEYNKSVICFENTLRIQPDFEAASQRRHAVMCHAKLEAALEAQHMSLQRTLSELKDYQKKHAYWQTEQEKLLEARASSDMIIEQTVAFEKMKSRQNSQAMGEVCTMVEFEGRQKLKCEWAPRKSVDLEWFFQKPQYVESSDGEKNVEASKEKVEPSKPKNKALYVKRKPDKKEDEYKLPIKKKDWPNKEECDTYVQKFPQSDEYPTTYLAAKNKGFDVRWMLTEGQGLKKGMQHPLPWYPPVCVSLLDIDESRRSYDHLDPIKERSKIPVKLVDESMKPVLLSLIGEEGMTEEEVGQRILTALKQKTGPSWVLYDLAGLYWRAIGNNYHGIECLRRSISLVPQMYSDVPKVNLANILYKWGKYIEATLLMKDALFVNAFEPNTQFFMANLQSANQNYSGAIWHYEESLHQQEDHPEAYNMLRAIKCYQKFHRTAQSSVPPVSTPPLTCKTEGPDQETGTVICKNDGGKENCVIETQLQGPHCPSGNCKQTCTITPIKADGCDSSSGVSIGPNCGTTSSNGVEKSIQCPSSNPQQPGSGECAGAAPIRDPNFNAKLDEISHHLEEKGWCQGSECQRLLVQQNKPHTRLEVINGILHQKLIYTDSDEDIDPQSTDCIIFNDGTKSMGCSREDFQPYQLDKIAKQFQEQLKNININKLKHMDLETAKQIMHETLGLEVMKQAMGSDYRPPDDIKLVFLNEKKEEKAEEKLETEPVEAEKPDDQEIEMTCTMAESSEQHCKPCTANTCKNNLMQDKFKMIPLDSIRRVSNSSQEVTLAMIDKLWNIDASQLMILQKRNDLLSMFEIASRNPHPIRHLRPLRIPNLPNVASCYEMPHYELERFKGTVLLVKSMGLDVHDYVDFRKTKPKKEPICDPNGVQELHSGIINVIDGVKNPEVLIQSQEPSLLKVMTTVPGYPISLEHLGASLGHALEKDRTNWVAAYNAIMYWRIKGNTRRAMECIRLSFSASTTCGRHLSLTALGMLLYQSWRLDDALLVMNVALEAQPEFEVIHYIIANILSAKKDYYMALHVYMSAYHSKDFEDDILLQFKRLICRKVRQELWPGYDSAYAKLAGKPKKQKRSRKKKRKAKAKKNKA